MPDEIKLHALRFLDVLKRGTTVDICAEHCDYVTTTEILDSVPDGEGGLALTLDATIEEGELVVTEAMIAGAEHDGDCWWIRHGGLVFRFGPDGFFTHNPEALEEHRRVVQARDARRDARRAEQECR